MKRKLLFIAIVLSFAESAFSQEYHPLLNNSKWVVSDWVSCCRPPYIRVIENGTDAVVGEHTYKKFHDTFPYSGIDTVYVREDVLERKVYKIVDDQDELLYDFSLETGETIMLNNKLFVATCDEISCEAGMRKRIVLNTVDEYNGHILTQTWIEGVGTIAHPFYPDRNMYNVMSTGGGVVYTTRCEIQDNVHIYGNPELCTTYLATPDFEGLNKSIVISPNPFSAELTIASEFDFTDATLQLYNIRGQLIREMKNLSGRSVLLQRENLTSGLYLIQLSEGDQVIKTEKVVVE